VRDRSTGREADHQGGYKVRALGLMPDQAIAPRLCDRRVRPDDVGCEQKKGCTGELFG